MTHTFKLSRRTARLRAASLASLLALIGGCDNTDLLAPAAEDVVAPSFAVSSSSISISNLRVASGATYRVAWGLAAGSRPYVDRTYEFTSVPSALAGLAYIQTANADKLASPGSTSFLSFDISTDADVYVGHDNRLSRPSWLGSNFQDTGLDLVSSDGLTRFSVLKRRFVRGRVTLGSNVGTNAGAEQSMYVVLINPASLEAAPSLSVTPTTGGMPFGFFHLPNGEFGSLYNGALRNIWPEYLLSNLAAIKARGGKVMLNLAGHEKFYKDASGRFSFTMWKAQIDRFRSVNIAPYINDGTIIGHYLIDEPYDAYNYGAPVPGSTIEAMAKYSKAIWPNMVTVVRADPGYLDNWSGDYQYLDAAWAQYLQRKGDVNDFIASNVTLAKRKGLALVVGLNIRHGGTNGGMMTASQVKTWGTAILNNSYPCAFLSWEYVSSYLDRSDVRSSMFSLRDLAKNRSFKSCRGA